MSGTIFGTVWAPLEPKATFQFDGLIAVLGNVFVPDAVVSRCVWAVLWMSHVNVLDLGFSVVYLALSCLMIGTRTDGLEIVICSCSA